MKYYVTGSPPQVRGKHSTVFLLSAPDGITPAGAGKTVLLFLSIRSIQDHPRRCGENLRQHREDRAARGSPPQVRGKRHDYAEARYWRRDHPRRCGENRPRRGICVKMTGITPAGAGKTGFSNAAKNNCRDHPRRCGENVGQRVPEHVRGGSPPQVRGKHVRTVTSALIARITPAGAGKTAQHEMFQK